MGLFGEYNTDKHHTLWRRKDYHAMGGAPKQLRQHPAMIVEMDVGMHRGLHSNIEPLPVMSKSLAKIALRHLEGRWGASGLVGFEDVTAFMYRQAISMEKTATEAGMFAEQFSRQRGYMW